MIPPVPPDPVSLDVSDYPLCEGTLPPPPATTGREPGLFRFSFLPCFSLAMLLHLGGILGICLSVTTALPDAVFSISLLPAMGPSGSSAGPPAALPGQSPSPGERLANLSAVPEQSPEALPDFQNPPSPPREKAIRSKPKRQAKVVKQAESIPVKPVVPKDEPPMEAPPEPQGKPDETGRESAMAAGTQSGLPGREVAAAGSIPDEGFQVTAGGGGGGAKGIGSGRGGGSGLSDVPFGDAEGPRFIHRTLPKYPELARRRGKEGRVVLRLVIDSEGNLKHADVVEKAGHGFDEAALEAVRKSTYAPATRAGRPVDCSAILPVRFALRSS